MAEKILILGGTKEAAELAKRLAKIHGDEAVMTSLAGRTKEPKPVVGLLRIGGFGGATGLANYLVKHRITQLIDATHPFAERISSNAVSACEQTGTPLSIRARPPWEKQAGDQWIEVQNLEEARAHIPHGATVLLAIGAQHLAVFKGIEHATLIARTVDGPNNETKSLVHKWITGRPSANANDEAHMLSEHAVTHIICRNSGGTGAYAKIEAARSLALPVIIVQRPTVHV